MESVKQAHGIRNEALVTEKYQSIINYELNRPVKIREARIINNFSGWVLVLMGLFLTKIF